MTTDILTVSYARDFDYLEYAIKSVAKFVTGFRQFIILVPFKDLLTGVHRFGESAGVTPINWLSYRDWPDNPMIKHMYEITCSDLWTDADAILHTDSDCIFSAPVTPATYINDGKPILRYERFETLGVRHPGAAKWQEVAQFCLPFPVLAETMRCHGAVFLLDLYPMTRQLIEQKLDRDFEGWMRTLPNAFPQQFCEFVTLGNVAMQYFPERYELVQQSGDRVTPDNHIIQFWSHRPPSESQRIWVQGGEVDVVPAEMAKKVLD